MHYLHGQSLRGCYHFLFKPDLSLARLARLNGGHQVSFLREVFVGCDKRKPGVSCLNIELAHQGLVLGCSEKVVLFGHSVSELLILGNITSRTSGGTLDVDYVVVLIVCRQNPSP